MSYVCSSLMACPSCGMGCNYTCSSSTPDLGTCVEEASNMVVSNDDNYISKTRGLGGENRPVLPADANFDGAAVKQNWIPLVVLGLSLVVGIGLSEWATKKYIK